MKVYVYVNLLLTTYKRKSINEDGILEVCLGRKPFENLENVSQKSQTLSFLTSFYNKKKSFDREKIICTC